MEKPKDSRGLPLYYSLFPCLFYNEKLKNAILSHKACPNSALELIQTFSLNPSPLNLADLLSLLPPITQYEFTDPSFFVDVLVKYFIDLIGLPNIEKLFVGQAQSIGKTSFCFSQLKVDIPYSSISTPFEFYVRHNLKKYCKNLIFPEILIFQLIRQQSGSLIEITPTLKLKGQKFDIAAVFEVEDTSNGVFYSSHVRDKAGTWLTLSEETSQFEVLDPFKYELDPFISDNCYCVVYVCRSPVTSEEDCEKPQIELSKKPSVISLSEEIVEKYLTTHLDGNSNNVFVISPIFFSKCFESGFKDWNITVEARNYSLFCSDYLFIPFRYDPSQSYWIGIIVDMNRNWIMFYDPLLNSCLYPATLLSSKMIEFLSSEYSRCEVPTYFRANEWQCFELEGSEYPRVDVKEHTGYFVLLFFHCCHEYLSNNNNAEFDNIQFNFGVESIETMKELVSSLL